MRIELTVKGRPASPDVAPNTLLVEALGDGHAVTAIEGLKAPPRPVPAASGGCHIPAIPAS